MKNSKFQIPNYKKLIHNLSFIIRNSQSGQVIIILLLALLVALTISLSLVQSSITNLSSATKTEQSSRAFSAAEAGLEKALFDPSATSVSLSETGNRSQAAITVQPTLPADGSALAVEYPPIGRADFAHIWLADPNDITGETAGTRPYKKNQTSITVAIYFGDITPPDPGDNLPAIEINYISGDYNTISQKFTTYYSTRYYYDSDPTRTTNGFTNLASLGKCNGVTTVNTTSGNNRSFKCSFERNLKISPDTRTPILLRIRVLYSNKNQPIAVGPNAASLACAAIVGSYCNLPPQATLYTSTGTSGQTEKTLTVFKEKSVPLSFFDYAIFSIADIKK